jgi:hypothetical protein
MTRRAKIWWVVALLFSVVNLAGAVSAVLQAEPIHAGIHAGLMVLGVYLVWRLAPRRVAEY